MRKGKLENFHNHQLIPECIGVTGLIWVLLLIYKKLSLVLTIVMNDLGLKIIVKNLAEMSTNNDALLYDIAVLFAKTGFYEPSLRINNPDLDPFEIIIEKFILPDIDNFNIILYEKELVGFYSTHLITNITPRELNTITATKQINWSNLGETLYSFYEVYFNNNEFLIDNIAIKEQFQKQGIYLSIIYPAILSNAKRLRAKSIVIAVFKYQNHNAYKLYLKQLFVQIASLKFQLEPIILSPSNEIEGRLEEIVLLRLPLII